MIAHLYIIIWCLWRIQDVMKSNGAISLVLFLPFLFLTLLYASKTIFCFKRGPLLKGLTILFLLFAGYGFFHALTAESTIAGIHIRSSHEFLLSIINSMLPVLSLYYFIKKGMIHETHIKLYFLLFIVISIIEYQQTQVYFLSLSNADETTNNAGYIFVALIPFLYLFRRKVLLQYILLGILSFFIISSMKRGAIVVYILMICVFIKYTYHNLIHDKKRFLIFFCFIVFVFAAYSYVQYMMQTSELFAFRVSQTEAGDSSNRDVIYGKFLNYYLNEANMFQQIFGSGVDATLRIGKILAHQDWLEIAVNFGFIGLLIYFIYWLRFIKQCRLSKHNSISYPILLSCFIFLFVRSLFSMSFADMPFTIDLVIAYAIFNTEKSYNINI